MAGKNIFIERILDNLLSGIDGALASMKAAMEKMIGGEDPSEQASLFDVVTKLDDVVGEDGKSLSDVTTALAENSAAIIGTGDKSLTDVTEALNTIVQDVSEKIDEQLEKLDDVINAIESGITDFKLISGNSDILEFDVAYSEHSYNMPASTSNESVYNLSKKFEAILDGRLDLYAEANVKTNYNYTPGDTVRLRLFDITANDYVSDILYSNFLKAAYRQTEYSETPTVIYLKGCKIEKGHSYRLVKSIYWTDGVKPSEAHTVTAKVKELTIEYSRQTTGQPGGAIVLTD